MAQIVGNFVQAQPIWFLAATFFILGAIWGSFVVALCSRWPKGESITHGRSRCDHCGDTIAARDLIPIISFLLLRGRCRHCQQPLSQDIIGVELAAAAVGVLPFLLLSAPQAAALAVFGWLLMPLAILDLRYLWLPDLLVSLLAAAGLAVAPLLDGSVSFNDRLIGGVAGFAALELMRRAYRVVRRRDGMGAGDPKLFAAIGVWQGWQLLPFIVLLASLVGMVWVLLTRNAQFKNEPAFPFGSYLSVAAYLIAWTG